MDTVGRPDSLTLLAERILSELQLLTASTKASALVRFQKDYLGTVQRQKIYQAVDGQSDSQAISDETGVPLRTVQAFVKELAENDLIAVSKQGHSIIPQKSAAKIATYYAEMDLRKAGEEEVG